MYFKPLFIKVKIAMCVFRLVFLYLILLAPLGLFSQNVAGYWQGVVYQPSGGTSTYYPSSITIDQNGNAITGSYTEQNPGSPYYAILAMTGTIASGVLTWDLNGFIRQNALPLPNYWCPSSNGTWTFNS